MDILKQELVEKRKTLAKDIGGKRFFKRSEIQHKEIHKLRAQEKREVEAKAHRQIAAGATVSSAATTSKTLILEQNLVLPKYEVIRSLRFLKQPITLFAEDDDARIDRLKYVLKSGTFEVDSDMIEGQTNVFLRDIAELRKRKDREEGAGELKRIKANFEDEDDKIFIFFKRILSEWKLELDVMPEAEKWTAKGKSAVATFKQCARYLNPKVLPEGIRRTLVLFVECCMKRDYLGAMDHYIKMTIGNAAWPIGVTMVGIHERSAREKIYTNTNSVAHIMNDETTLKYLHSVKRLMTFCQLRYPTMPSKSVDFNTSDFALGG
ncbi:Pre-mRNA-splicing factor 18 [Euphorbia peplus]|nr:Pre-mRNA-splicing factor 18 [Euphorbia peplus]